MTFRLPAAACRALAVFVLLVASIPVAAKDIWDAAPLTGDPKQMLAAAAAFDAKSASVVYLLNETTYAFGADGKTKTTWHLIERVVTEEGASEAGTASAWWAPWYDAKPAIEARVIGSDGVVHVLDPKAITEATEELERDMFSDQRVLRAPLPGVTTGSIVETVVTTEGRSPVAGGGKFGRFDFGAGVAIERSRLVLDAPAGIVPQILNKSGLEPRIVEENGHKVTIFEKGHTDAIDEIELATAPDELPYPYVAFATGSSWGEIAKNYSATVDRQIATSNDQQIAASVDRQIATSNVKDIVASAIGKTKDRDAIAEKLLDIIRKSVRYAGVEVGDGSFVPRTPSFVMQNKYGDCKDKATLLVAMLRAAGIDAHVALLGAGFGFDTVASLPAVDSFNHAIVVVSGSPALWIDPTDEFSRAGEIPLEDQGRMALIASPATTALTLTPEAPATANRYIERRTFTLPEEGKSHVTEVTEGTRREDATLRRDYATAEKKAYRDAIEKYEAGYFVAPKIDSLDTGDPHDFSKPFQLTVNISKSRSGVVNNGEADVLIPMYDIVTTVPQTLRNYEPKSAEAQNAKPEKRRLHDFYFARPVAREWVYHITPAAGFQAQTLPQNETTKLGTATLTTEYSKQSDGSVVARVVFESGKRRITPAEYDATRTAISALARRDGVHLRFESTGQAKVTAGDIGGALVEFRKLAALHPKEAQHHIELARALLAGGLGEAARDEAKRAVAVEPGSAKAYAMLATVLENDLLGREYRHGCDLPGAVDAMRKAKSLDPDDLTFRVRLGELLIFGDDGFRFGHGAHLAEAADEFRSLLKDFGDEAKPQQPRLMLILTHERKWDEVKQLVKAETDVRQRDLFHLIAVTATDGSAAGLRELAAFDTTARRGYGTGVGQAFMQLRRYSDAADFVEAASKGSEDASKTLPVVQLLRKAQPYDKLSDDSPKALFMRFMKAIMSGEGKTVRALFVPEVVSSSDDEDFVFNTSQLTNGGEMRPEVALDLTAAGTEITQEGSDDIGYRYRARATGMGAQGRVLYAVKRDGKLMLVAASNVPSLIGVEAMKFANEGKTDAARTWLNWAREVVPVTGGDDPLESQPFARLWQKETASATGDQIRIAAAALMVQKEFAKESAAALETLRDKAATDDAKTEVDVALMHDYRLLNDWAKLAPVAERLSKAHPDSDSAFVLYIEALSALNHSGDKGADGEKLATERLATHPKDVASMRALVNVMSRRGDYESAEKWARRLVDDVTPTEGDYNDAAWVALFRGKELQRAIEDARHATTDGSGGSSAALHTLAAVYAETGNSVEARQALMKSLDARASGEPRSADWFVLGRIAETYGVSDAAAAAYKRVTKEEPNGLTTWELTQRRLASLH